MELIIAKPNQIIFEENCLGDDSIYFILMGEIEIYNTFDRISKPLN